MKTLIQRLSTTQRVSLLLAFVVVAGSILGLIRWNRERDFHPLYTQVAAEDAGLVLAKLKEMGVEYRVSDGGASILVPSTKVAELRLQMAALGLPKSGRIGYELFDKTNFGITDFTEQVNYHRALEGELERSVMAMSEVEQARVHLTLPRNSLFLENRQEAKASVMVKLRPMQRLSPQNVLAVMHLVSSAVEGLKPESVSVLDMQGNLLNRARKEGTDSLEASDAALDYKQRVEKDLLVKVNGTLEPLLGAEKFRVGVSADCDLSGVEQSEEIVDPNRSVMVTSQKTEDVAGGTQASGVPGTASSLPRPTSRPGSGSTGTTRKTENITYQSSRMVKHTRQPQGAVKRLSISVLLDQSIRWEGTGPKAKRILEPPSPEKLKVIRDLVAGAAGLQTDRGDQLIVESLAFENTLSSEPPPAPAIPGARPQPEERMPVWLASLLTLPKPVLIGVGVGAGLVLLLGVVWMWRGKGRKRASAAASRQPTQPALTQAEQHQLEADQIRKQLEGQIAGQQALKERQELETLASIKVPTVTTQKSEVLSKHLAAETKKDPQAIAHIMRTWLSER